MVYRVIVIDKKHVRVAYAKIWNIKRSWWIYNELLNSRTNDQAGKSVVRAWQPIAILESVYMGGAKVKFDIAAWWFKMVSTGFCILLDLSINLWIVNGCHLVIVWLFGTLWCWECTDLTVCCFAWLQRNTEGRSSIVRSKSHVFSTRDRMSILILLIFMLEAWMWVIMVLCDCRIYKEYQRTCEWLICVLFVASFCLCYGVGALMGSRL